MKKTILMALAFTALLVACKKDETNSSISIVGKWNSVSKVDWYTPTGSSTQKDTTASHSGEYIDFRTDGKAYLCRWVSPSFYYDTATYTVNGNNVIFASNSSPVRDTAVVQTLTSNKLVFYNKYVGIDNIEEVWSNFSK